MSYVPNPRPAGDFRTTYKDDNRLFKTHFETRSALVLLAVVIVAAPLSGTTGSPQLILIGIYAIAAIGLNILVGTTGQISLGHAAFFGFGAFASAWLANSFGVPVLIAMPAAAVLTTAVGMIFGVPAARIKGPLSRHRHPGVPVYPDRLFLAGGLVFRRRLWRTRRAAEHFWFRL